MIRILQAGNLPEATASSLHEQFDVATLPGSAPEADAMLARIGPDIRGIAVRKTIIDAALLDRLPNVEVIASYSAGLENVDVGAARTRGIAVHNTSHILADEVADLALALILAMTRGIVRGHDFIRDGRWLRETPVLERSPRSLRAGIVGLGHVGSTVAKRLEAIGVETSYTDRQRKPASLNYFATVLELAAWADILILTCPATAATFHLANSAVFETLRGYLVNISRGTVVDERALVEALKNNTLAGAALDVFEDEPNVPRELIDDPRVVLSPHMASATHETRARMGQAVVDALAAHFQAAAVPTGELRHAGG